MQLRTHILSVPGAAVTRGFWLYVCRVESPRGELVYVGQTGDTNFPFSGSAFNRLANHLVPRGNTSSLFDRPCANGIDPRDCGDIRMVAVGPVFAETSDRNEFNTRKDAIRELERRLCRDMTDVGYQVINNAGGRGKLDEELWQQVRAEFAIHFPKLNNAEEGTP